MNYSLLVMESAGMMKMDTGEVPPSGRVPEQGPERFLVLQRLAAAELQIYSVPRSFEGICEYIGERST